MNKKPKIQIPAQVTNKNYNFRCTKCYQQFSHKAALTVHVHNTHNKCSKSVYGKGFKKRLKLNEKLFVCKICCKRFSNKGNLRVHVSNHEKAHRHPKNKLTDQSECQAVREKGIKMKVIYDIDPDSCSDCKKYLQTLKHHIETVHHKKEDAIPQQAVQKNVDNFMECDMVLPDGDNIVLTAQPEVPKNVKDVNRVSRTAVTKILINKEIQQACGPWDGENEKQQNLHSFIKQAPCSVDNLKAVSILRKFNPTVDKTARSDEVVSEQNASSGEISNSDFVPVQDMDLCDINNSLQDSLNPITPSVGINKGPSLSDPKQMEGENEPILLTIKQAPSAEWNSTKNVSSTPSVVDSKEKNIIVLPVSKQQAPRKLFINEPAVANAETSKVDLSVSEHLNVRSDSNAKFSVTGNTAPCSLKPSLFGNVSLPLPSTNQTVMLMINQAGLPNNDVPLNMFYTLSPAGELQGVSALCTTPPESLTPPENDVELDDLGLPVSERGAVKRFQNYGLLPEGKICSLGHEMKVAFGTKSIRWMCARRSCMEYVSVRRGTWFENSRLPYEKMLRIIYYWCQNTTAAVKFDLEGLGISKSSSVVWNNILREVTILSVKKNKEDKIGGIGKTVEVVETLLSRGRLDRNISERWLVGGVCRETKKTFLKATCDRDPDTLMEVICEKVEIGSSLYTGSWKGYVSDKLKQVGFRLVRTNNNKTAFLQTQNAEKLCENAKSYFKSLQGIPTQHLDAYLSVFIWRSELGGDDAFDRMLKDIAEFFPPKQGEEVNTEN